MAAVAPLIADRLRTRCDPATLDFETTADLATGANGGESVGQARVLEALSFGVGMGRDGYNVFVMGPTGIGKQTLAAGFLGERAARDPVPPDWCYVYNFDEPHKPRAIALPAGKGREFRHTMDRLVEELQGAIPAAFESDEYRGRLQEIEEEFKERQEEAMEQVAKEAAEQGVKLVRTPRGFSFAPVRDGEVVGPEEFAKLPEDQQEHVKQTVESLQERLQTLMFGMAQSARESREKVRGLNREFALAAVGSSIAEVKARYAEQPKIAAYLDAVKADVVGDVTQFRGPRGDRQDGSGALTAAGEAAPLDRWAASSRRRRWAPCSPTSR